MHNIQFIETTKDILNYTDSNELATTFRHIDQFGNGYGFHTFNNYNNIFADPIREIFETYTKTLSDDELNNLAIEHMNTYKYGLVVSSYDFKIIKMFIPNIKHNIIYFVQFQ